MPVRVLYFTRDYTPHDHRFLTSLDESGVEVHFLRLERSRHRLEDRSLPQSIRQVRWQGGEGPFRWRDLPRLLLGLRRVLRDVQPDIVHAGPVQTAGFLGALSGFRPLVTMSWGSDLLKDAGRSRMMRWITRYTLSRSTVLVGDCQAVRDRARQFGMPGERIYTFPWGIDLSRFSPGQEADFRARLGWQDCFVVLSLRSWEAVYGIDVALRGFAAASERAPELRLLMLGGGSLAGMVHSLIQQHQLQDRIYLGGQVKQENLSGIYRAADVYLSASHSDGSSVSLMEAMGSGLPALVSAIPSNHEWVTPGVEGWLFPDGDAQALASGLLRALEMAKQQPEQYAALGRAARLKAEAKADWRKNFAVLQQAYQAALRQSGRKAAGENERAA